MKKIIIVLLSLIVCFNFFGCVCEHDYFAYVSDFRKDILIGEKDDYTAIVYCSLKEYPCICDGIKNDSKFYLTIKFVSKQEISDPVTVSVEYNGNSYQKQLTYNPVATTLSTDICVNDLPDESVTLNFNFKNTDIAITCESKLLSSTINYLEALKNAVKKAEPFINENTKNNAFNGEIYLRLLYEGQRNYYYVGFVNQNGLKLAILIDGESGEVIAQKKM